MRESVATVVGFLAASTIPAAVYSALAPVMGESRIVSVAGAFAVFYPFSAAFTLLLGVPTFLLLRRFGPGRWWAVLAVGFVLGILVTIVLQLPNRTPRDFFIAGLSAAVSALVFWLIWKRSASKQ